MGRKGITNIFDDPSDPRKQTQTRYVDIAIHIPKDNMYAQKIKFAHVIA